jgi:hypothetical protein
MSFLDTKRAELESRACPYCAGTGRLTSNEAMQYAGRVLKNVRVRKCDRCNDGMKKPGQR